MSVPLDQMAEGEAEWCQAVARAALVRQQGGRAAAEAAAEALEAEGIEARPWRLRDGWGLAAAIGGTTVAGPIGEVREWAAGQAHPGQEPR